jgi:hypothetical protein
MARMFSKPTISVNFRSTSAMKFGIEPASNEHEEVICMQYLVFAIGGGTIVLAAGRAYKLLERWNRRRRLRGAVECLDAVHNTLAGLAECKSGYSESTLPNKRK